MPKLKKHSVVQKSYQCEFCKVKCRRPQDLRRHLFVHTEASFQCDSCGNKFTRYDTLMRHKRDNCRNAQFPWTERKDSSSGSPTASTELTRNDSPKQKTQNPNYQPMSPARSGEHVSQGTTSPLLLAQAYSPQPCVASIQPLLPTGLAPPQLPPPLNGYSVPPWPPEQTYLPQTPPQFTVSPGSPVAAPPASGPAYAGAPAATMPNYPSLQGFGSPTYFPGFVHSDPPRSTIPGLAETSGAGATRAHYYSSDYAFDPSSQNIGKELPRLSNQPFEPSVVKREKSLQPLEPDPLQFKGGPIRQISNFPLKRNSMP